MTRAEHNAKWNATRQPDEQVHCHTGGYGEISQYDGVCSCCWLGHQHDWAEHDRAVSLARAQDARFIARLQEGGYSPDEIAQRVARQDGRFGHHLQTVLSAAGIGSADKLTAENTF
jgi:hypothetical protein